MRKYKLLKELPDLPVWTIIIVSDWNDEYYQEDWITQWNDDFSAILYRIINKYSYPDWIEEIKN